MKMMNLYMSRKCKMYDVGKIITWHEEIFTFTQFGHVISELFQPASVF